MTTPSWGFLIGRELAAAGDYDTIPLMPERMFDTRWCGNPTADGRSSGRSGAHWDSRSAPC